MEKKHTKYKTSLLIGLLSLYTLSSCVNTRQVLGNHQDIELGNDVNPNIQWDKKNRATYTVNPEPKITLIKITQRSSSAYSYVEHVGGETTKSTNSWTWKKKLVLGLSLVTVAGMLSVPVGVGVCAIGLICPFGATSFLPNNTLPNNTTLLINNSNSTFVVPGHPFDAPNRGGGRRGRMHIPKENEDHYTSILDSSFSQFEPTEVVSSENESTEDIFFQDMTIHQLYHKILNKDFDPDMVRAWLQDGLNPNMKDLNQRTLFMLVVEHYKNIKEDDWKAIDIITSFLQTGKINFSKKDSNGQTVWDYTAKNHFLKNLFRRYKHKK
ncbi:MULTISPECIES: hypothetical protein [unclassified Candidatus Cardinium]|uniref:hypothetical protein n=1 Tax=unclassified Candidatus Cardinium TaxID=2641185 RepID=UPI001FB56212|nr:MULTISPECIES: hypothetical protein [unclassified Candidatus Cardinium]